MTFPNKIARVRFEKSPSNRSIEKFIIQKTMYIIEIASLQKFL